MTGDVVRQVSKTATIQELPVKVQRKAKMETFAFQRETDERLGFAEPPAQFTHFRVQHERRT